MKRLALHALYRGGFFSLTRALTSNMARILMYHNFSGPGESAPDALNTEGVRNQFTYLREYFHVVRLAQIVEQLTAGQSPGRKAVALTIDDGRRNCYQFFFPLLKEFQIPATFFVVTSFIQGEDWVWTDKVLWLSEQERRPSELAPENLDGTFRRLNRQRPEVRNQQINDMAASVGVPIPQQPPAKYAPCSWKELREMAESGLVEIGSHTVSHPILSSITDEESWHELSESRRQIEEGIGRKVNSFCFPNGMPGDYRASQVQQLQQAGYECSVVAEFGLVAPGADPYQLRRIGMGRKCQPIEIAKYLDGLAHYQWQFEKFLGRASTKRKVP